MHSSVLVVLVKENDDVVVGGKQRWSEKARHRMREVIRGVSGISFIDTYDSTSADASMVI